MEQRAGRFRVLIAAADAGLRHSAAQALDAGGAYDRLEAHTRAELLLRIGGEGVQLAVVDLSLAPVDSASWFDEVQAAGAGVPIIVLSSLTTVETAIELLHRGAFDYLIRPFKTVELEGRVRRAAERAALLDEIRALRGDVSEPAGVARLIGRAQSMQRLLRELPAIARSEAAVLIFGESGTGKELVAQALHGLSPRSTGPWVTVNCGALPDALLENELFGHARGAYTDAGEDYCGLVQQADGGTLLLDEVGELSLATQVKLLRFLQEKEYRPLGATRTVKANVRVIAATNRDLKAAVAEGSFREDLFYRLNIIPLTLPPLRERKEDIPLLVAQFLRRMAAQTGNRIGGLSPLAMRKLMTYGWPGNVRELENKIQQIVALSDGTEIRPEQIELPLNGAFRAADGRPKSFKEAKREVVTAFEIDYLSTLLVQTNGNISEAARVARKHRRAFWEIMKKHGLCGRASCAAETPDEKPEPEPVPV